jgi:hypothetical protein
MHMGPICFKEILFFDFLEEWAPALVGSLFAAWEREIEKRDFSFPK